MKTFSGYIGENLFHPEILKMVFFSLDSNNNGQIDYTEFQALFSQNDLFKNEKLLMEQFKLVDVVRLPKSILLFNRLTFKREDGVLDKSEIKEFFQTTCGDISESSLFSIIQDIDLNGDGKVRDQYILRNNTSNYLDRLQRALAGSNKIVTMITYLIGSGLNLS